MKSRLRNVISIVSIGFSFSVLAADAPSWQWARQADISASGATASAKAVSVDPSGAIYVAGTFKGTIKFGSTSLTVANSGYEDVFVAKFDNNGSPLWALSAGGLACNAAGIAATAAKVYLTGDCVFGAAFGGNPLGANPNYRSTFYLATIDPAGRFLSVVPSGGSGDMKGRAVTLDSSGDVVVVGSFSQSATLLGASVTASGNLGDEDAFVAKFNADVNQLSWINTGGGDYSDHANAVSIDNDGNVLIAGDIVSDVSSGGATFGSTTLTVGTNPSYSGDPFVAKLDKNGNWQWAKSIAASAFDYAQAIVADSAGNTYVAGRFSVQGQFGNISVPTVALNSYYAFVTKLDANGNFLWAKQAGTVDNLIGVDAAAYALSISKNGNPVVAGTYSGKSAFDGFVLTSVNNHDGYVAELDASTGSYQWVKGIKGYGGSAPGNALALAPSGDFLVAGSFYDSVGFDTYNLSVNRPGENFITGPFLASLGTSNAVLSDCLFGWAERSYSQYFAPAGVASAIYGAYYFRYYPTTNSYLATSSADGHLWYIGSLTGNVLSDFGPTANYLAAAGCQ